MPCGPGVDSLVFNQALVFFLVDSLARQGQEENRTHNTQDQKRVKRAEQVRSSCTHRQQNVGSRTEPYEEARQPKENVLFFELSLCLSRACLGKKIIYI